jgi:hypothetical protein
MLLFILAAQTQQLSVSTAIVGKTGVRHINVHVQMTLIAKVNWVYMMGIMLRAHTVWFQVCLEVVLLLDRFSNQHWNVSMMMKTAC